jgi:hypothetical protein
MGREEPSSRLRHVTLGGRRGLTHELEILFYVAQIRTLQASAFRLACDETVRTVH